MAFDSTQYIDSLRQQYIEKEIDKKELDRRITKLGEFLESQPDNVVILQTSVVFGNVKTINPE